MFAGDEISERAPDAFIDGDDGRELHQVLNGRDGFGIARMQVQIAVANWENGFAVSANQPPVMREKVSRKSRRTPSRLRSTADTALKSRKDFRNPLGHDTFSLSDDFVQQNW